MAEHKRYAIDDVTFIKARLEEIEREKAKVLEAPLPDVQPIHTNGYQFDYTDYDGC